MTGERCKRLAWEDTPLCSTHIQKIHERFMRAQGFQEKYTYYLMTNEAEYGH